MKFRSIKGTKDILPGEVETWQHVESTIRRVMGVYNYREIRTPIFETTALFSRSIGELTDIVTKEMYTFKDRSDESITLRPEGTAAALRAHIQNNLGELAPLTKLYYLGPMFRQERPQAGRLRQFHQFGAEALGSQSTYLDVEMMLLAGEILKTAGVKAFDLKVNSVGCQDCRPAYKKLLTAGLKKIKEKLSPVSQERIENNPLRVLDSKNEEDIKHTAHVPLMKDHLCKECADHFAAVQSLLHSLNIKYEIDGRLVRGLDYYTGPIFEISVRTKKEIGSIAGGGRYDKLVETYGGRWTPAVGISLGMERICEIMEAEKLLKIPQTKTKAFVAVADDSLMENAMFVAQKLRAAGINSQIELMGRPLRKQLEYVDRAGIPFAVIVGAMELKKKKYTVREMAKRKQGLFTLDKIIKVLGEK